MIVASIPYGQQPRWTRRRRLAVFLIVLVASIVVVGTFTWVVWLRPGPSVTLVGIDRTLTYEGNYSGYVSGTITSGCLVCPLVMAAGSTVLVNVTWVSTDPLGSHLNYTFLNITIRSPFPFLALGWTPPNRPSVYGDHYTFEAGGPGGATGDTLPIDIPFDSGGLPATGVIDVWINASANAAAPWPPPPLD